MTTEKFCTKCGKKFVATGREVICPACKAQATEEAKRAAVLKAKRASWSGESVPVRISGRASTVIREYGAAHSLPFAAALDDLLKASDYFKGIGVEWSTIVPYKSRRRSKATSTPQDVQDEPQDVQDEPVKPVKTAAKVAKTTSKASTSTATSKKVATAAGKKGEKKA